MLSKGDLTMRGHQLREILNDIRTAISGSGGTKHADALDRIQSALADLDHAPAGDVISRVESAATTISSPPWSLKLSQLQGVGLNEAAFLKLIEEISADKSLKKADLLQITQAYVGYADKKASSAKMIDAIKTRFYGKIYDRDADIMAKRATPW